MVRELDELLDTGFRGPETERVRAMVHEIDTTERHCDEMEISLREQIKCLVPITGNRHIDTNFLQHGFCDNYIYRFIFSQQDSDIVKNHLRAGVNKLWGYG